MTALYPDIIYGPVHSRRLGLSLGVNLLPLQSKICSFDCIYCECGWNADNRGRSRFNSRESVREALREHLQGTTVILIAQRIASVRNADRIAVLENGTITHCAPHEELMRVSETYRDIYDSQMRQGGTGGTAV